MEVSGFIYLLGFACNTLLKCDRFSCVVIKLTSWSSNTLNKDWSKKYFNFFIACLCPSKHATVLQFGYLTYISLRWNFVNSLVLQWDLVWSLRNVEINGGDFKSVLVFSFDYSFDIRQNSSGDWDLFLTDFFFLIMNHQYFINVVATNLFCGGWWCDEAWKHPFVWVIVVHE